MSGICIVSNENAGNAIAFHFASKGYEVKVLTVTDMGVYDSNPKKKVTKIRNLKGVFVEVSTSDKPISWVDGYEAFSDAEIIIEAIHGSKDFKQAVLKNIEENTRENTPILTSGRVYFPSELASVLNNPSRLLGIYLYDVEHGNNNGEIITQEQSSKECEERVRDLLTQADLRIGVVKECVGFVHNRIGLFGIMCLLKFFDEKILTIQELSKYIVVTKPGPKLFFGLTLGKEAKYELVDAREVFIQLSEKSGDDQFRLPDYIRKNYEVTVDNVLEVIGQDSVKDYTIVDCGYKLKEFKNIYIKGLHTIYNNMIYPFLRGEFQLFFDEDESKEYFESTKISNGDLFNKITKYTTFVNEENYKEIDLIIDFSIEVLDEKIESCKKLQKEFGTDIPLLLNTPILKLEDIARGLEKPDMVFGMYTQKAYLANTELVINEIMDKATYISIRNLVKKLASNYIETKDTYVRPLAYFIVAKLLEASRLFEAGIATKEDIEVVGVDGEIFKYMDIFGLDKIAKISDYLEPIYGRTFTLPKILLDMKAKGRSFY